MQHFSPQRLIHCPPDSITDDQFESKLAANHSGRLLNYSNTADETSKQGVSIMCNYIQVLNLSRDLFLFHTVLEEVFEGEIGQTGGKLTLGECFVTFSACISCRKVLTTTRSCVCCSDLV